MVGFNPDRKVQLTSEDYLIAGAINATVARACVQPLDVLKIRFQLQVEPISRCTVSSKYHGLLQAVGSIVREEGVKALWKGHIPAQALSVTYSIVQFTVFEYLTKGVWQFLPDYFTLNLKPVSHAICGGLAATVSTIVVQPVDILRTRLIAQGEPKIYTSMGRAAVSIVRQEGPRALYKGLYPALWGVAPQMGLQFGLYTAFQETWDAFFKTNQEAAPVKNLICGSGAGLIAKLVIYPLDLVKKRLQIQGFEEARKPFGAVRQYSGLLNCLKSVLREESFFGLFKGLSPSLLKAAAVSGISFCLYDHVCYLMTFRHR